MALDYHKCAQEIADNIGGGSNVVSAAHCATRLRLVIADNGKVNKEALENVDGVKGMFESNGQLQLIIGTGTVNKVYDEFLAITGASAASKEEVKAAAAAKQPLYIRLLKPIGDVFVPILPAIVASGLMMGLVEALGNDNLPFGPAFKASDWYGFLDTVANSSGLRSKGIRRQYFPGSSHRPSDDSLRIPERLECCERRGGRQIYRKRYKRSEPLSD